MRRRHAYRLWPQYSPTRNSADAARYLLAWNARKQRKFAEAAKWLREIKRGGPIGDSLDALPEILAAEKVAEKVAEAPEAKAALEQFRAVQEQAGNAELVTAADEALRSCESLLAPLKPER